MPDLGPPHDLRHAGASDDLLSGHRALGEVKERGRWAADGSVRRYAKRTRMQTKINELDEELRDFGQYVNSHLCEVLNFGFRGTGRCMCNA